MVTLNRIYTRTGDGGSTRLASGEPVSKTHPRVSAYGAVDETNACLGLARLHTGTDPVLDAILMRAQNDLFDLGADLATPDRGETMAWEPLRILESQVERLEREIDLLNAELSDLTSFVLPGGAPAAAALHLARTVCRRAEREAVGLAGLEGEVVSPAAVKFLNRLSDLLFVASRWANAKGAGDVLWTPGANR
ncbi:MAG TPA: cob(I)yrinic acid a,c-diamide adenosyltransferase [Caulobacter sp.]|nr:cob(I)yrinic acid a,c-diamide adenosyltransferase [Caulobacter sp.]